jgi:hypothetical protein
MVPLGHLLASQQRANHYEQLFRNERKKLSRAASKKIGPTTGIGDLQNQLSQSTSSASAFRAALETRISELNAQLAAGQGEIAAAHKHNTAIVQQKNTLVKCVRRMPDRIETEASKLNLQAVKEHGIISDAIRSCVQDLVSLNVPVDNVCAIIAAVTEALNVKLVGNLSAWSVGRIVKEGGIKAQLQVVDELKQAQSAFQKFY